MPAHTPRILTIAAGVLDALVAHARAEAPRECCGLLVGTGGTVDEHRPARNLESGTTRYRIDPRDHFAAIRSLRGTGRDIVGGYHSHPRGAAQPSPTDVGEATDPDWVHVIVSLAGAEPRIAAFAIDNGIVERLVVESPSRAGRGSAVVAADVADAGPDADGG